MTGRAMAHKSTRREFLTGKAVGDAAAARLQEAVAGPVEPDGESVLLHVARRAMACQFQVFFNVGQYANDTEAALEALDLVEGLEAQLSVFRPTSEISRINALAADIPVPVEPRLFELLQLAQGLSEATAGAYDITASPLWKAWGFSRREGAIPTDEQLAEARRCVGHHWLELAPDEKTIRFRQSGVEINLGSIGKGYALDRAGECLTAAGIEDFLFHGGQSSVLARGSQTVDGRPADPAHPRGWTVGIRHPLRRNVRLAQVRLRNRALGTSGTENQFFRYRGRRYGHILDPRTGWPAEQLLSATVLAPSAALADALSTAFFVMGAEAALDYCQTHPEIAAVLLCPVRGAKGYEIRTAGLDDGALRLLVE
jgi:thiamine biosynthesis lipoprotein